MVTAKNLIILLLWPYFVITVVEVSTTLFVVQYQISNVSTYTELTEVYTYNISFVLLHNIKTIDITVSNI